MTSTRPVTLDDVPVLTDLVRANRQLLAPWEPLRPEEYFTTAGQAAVVQDALAAAAAGTGALHLVLDEDGTVVGRVTLSGIVRGALQSAALSYWIGERHQNRGHATAAVGAMVRLAFEEVSLHRLQAEILPRNIASQRVLARHGFTRFGTAPSYLKIAGRWQDHEMYQLLSPHDG